MKLILLLLSLVSLAAHGQLPLVTPPPIAARAFVLVDAQSGQTLAAAAENDRFEPASLTKLMTAWLAFDADFALGCFALHHGLRPATFGDRLDLAGSVHLDLSADPASQRIAYHLGGPHTVALLTGANSGGKTTLLEHVGQLVLMARLGLPVVGERVTVPWVDELHYVTARRSLDAGAFESFPRHRTFPRLSPLFWPATGAGLAVAMGKPLDGRRYAEMPREQALAELFKAVQEAQHRAERLRRK